MDPPALDPPAVYRDQTLPRPPGSPAATDIWWPPWETCWNMFREDPLVVPSGGQYNRHVQTCSLKKTPVVTSGGRYSWQVGGMHPTGMLSCLMKFLSIWGKMFTSSRLTGCIARMAVGTSWMRPQLDGFRDFMTSDWVYNVLIVP